MFGKISIGRNAFLGLLLSILFLVGLGSCGSVRSSSGGLSDQAYIVVTSVDQYRRHEVLVHIDNQRPQFLRVISSKQGVAKESYECIVVMPGKHDLRIETRSGREIFHKQIFVSTQTTRTIELP